MQPTQKKRAQLIENRKQEEELKVMSKIAEKKAEDIKVREEAEKKRIENEKKVEKEKEL